MWPIKIDDEVLAWLPDLHIVQLMPRERYQDSPAGSG